MEKQAIGYTRVSTDQQAKDGISLEAQKEKILAWCDYHGYELIDVFTDPGVSGASMREADRPQLHAALKNIKKGMPLITYSLSRLTRSTKDALHICELLKKKGADLVSLTENIDTTSAAGKMMLTMIATFAQFERDVTSERTKLAMQLKKSKGEYGGGGIPYGYVLCPEKKYLVMANCEQKLIAMIKELRHNGYTLLEIKNGLTQEGHLNRRGKPFDVKQISRILGETK